MGDENDPNRGGIVYVHRDMGEGFTHHSSPECGCAPMAFPADKSTEEIMSEIRIKEAAQVLKPLKKDILETLQHEIDAARNPPIDYAVAEDGDRMVVRFEQNLGMAEFLEDVSVEIGRLRDVMRAMLELHEAHHNHPIHAMARRLTDYSK